MTELILVLTKLFFCFCGVFLFWKTRGSAFTRTIPPWMMVQFGQKKYKRYKDIEIVVKRIETDANGDTLLIADVPFMKKYVVLRNMFEREIRNNEIAEEQILPAYLYKVEGKTFILDSKPPSSAEADVVTLSQSMEDTLQKKMKTMKSLGRVSLLCGAYLVFLSPFLGICAVAIGAWCVWYNIPFAEQEYWEKMCTFEPRPTIINSVQTDDIPEDYNEWSKVKKFIYEFDKRYEPTQSPEVIGIETPIASERAPEQSEKNEPKSGDEAPKARKASVLQPDDPKSPNEQLSFFSYAYSEAETPNELPGKDEATNVQAGEKDNTQVNEKNHHKCESESETSENPNTIEVSGADNGDEQQCIVKDVPREGDTEEITSDKVHQNAFKRSFQKRKYKSKSN